MKTVILGGTKGMGRALARELAERGHEIFLLGRNQNDLARSVADLQARHPSGYEGSSSVCNLEEPDGFSAALAEAQFYLGSIDTVVVTAGVFARQSKLERDIARVQQLLTVNFVNTILFCEHARKRLLANGGGTLCVLSSVAGDRGRKSVAVYGASKAGLSHYLESLDHKFRRRGLKTICVKPGFVRTGMTAGLKAPPFAGEPKSVAKAIVRAIEKGSPVVYTPAMWRPVMSVVRMLPRTVMRRLNF